MNWNNVMAIAGKELRVLKARPSIAFPLIFFPVVVSVTMPLVVDFLIRRVGTIPAPTLAGVLDSFMAFFLIGAGTLPTVLASYSLVGEKVDGSLEPLLATPASDTDILIGKGIGALLPPISAVLLGGVLYMIGINASTASVFGGNYFPNAKAAVILLVLAPLAGIFSVECSILISARSGDVRGAQQWGMLTLLPFMAIFMAAESKIIAFDLSTLLGLSLIAALSDALLFVASRALFQRDQILTRWK